MEGGGAIDSQIPTTSCPPSVQLPAGAADPEDGPRVLTQTDIETKALVVMGDHFTGQRAPCLPEACCSIMED